MNPRLTMDYQLHLLQGKFISLHLRPPPSTLILVQGQSPTICGIRHGDRPPVPSTPRVKIHSQLLKLGLHLPVVHFRIQKALDIQFLALIKPNLIVSGISGVSNVILNFLHVYIIDKLNHPEVLKTNLAPAAVTKPKLNLQGPPGPISTPY
ncbi:hypothetical protein K469DRAFT_44171 [Zopfia rhizophila CBS 207.26]|uniref:Uncharacterized protein n=1 Tax=Zopfia rhizophila CBS 207.26 TaxID=1314779 RepID=A0A6A6EIC0_9PEZI|nr:hypothetical protein K469DRAFT_44171 [Zopfia rhizophila CBS 207.26]